MAISTSMRLNVTPGGNDTNGGGFSNTGTDYSLQDSKNSGGNNSSTTDAVGLGTDHITSATASFTSAILGNLIYLSGGSGSLAAGWYEVIGWISATNIQLDHTVAVGTGITMNIGGALASVGTAGQIKAANGGTQGIYVDVKGVGGATIDYLLTTATQNVSGGPVHEATNTASGVDKSHLSVWEGYKTTRGDLGATPTIKINAGLASVTVFLIEGRYSIIRNLDINCNTQTTSTGINLSDFYSGAQRCIVRNSTVFGILAGDTADWIDRCFVTGASGTAGIGLGNVLGGEQRCYFSVVSNGTCPGFRSETGYIWYCISANNTVGFVLTQADVIGSDAYGNSSHGFDLDGDAGSGSVTGSLTNCIAEANGGWGYNSTAIRAAVHLNFCAGYNNTSGNYDATMLTQVEGFVVGSASFFTNAAGGNFSLNNNAGGGALLRGAGLPGTMPDGVNVGYADVGALQHSLVPPIVAVNPNIIAKLT